MDWKRRINNLLYILFKWGKWIFESIIRIAGPFFVVLATVLITGVIYVHFVNSIPFYSNYSSLCGIIHLAISIYITVNIGYNYLSAVFVSPGLPPKGDEVGLTVSDIETLKGHIDNDSERKILSKLPQDLRRYCKKCNRTKPERSHHCHVCGTCVLKMDHHCPWIANCVGHKNHHFFVLFLFWLWFGCGYASGMSYMPFLATANTAVPFKGIVSRGSVIFSFVIAVAVFIALTLMLCWQIYLMLSSQTTIEFYINRQAISSARKAGKVYRNPFDLGISANFQNFFGTRESPFWFSWLVPGGIKVVGDGISWIKRQRELPV